MTFTRILILTASCLLSLGLSAHADSSVSCKVALNRQAGLPDLLPLAEHIDDTPGAVAFFSTRFVQEFSLADDEQKTIPMAFVKLLVSPRLLTVAQSRAIESFLNRDHLESPLTRKIGEQILKRKLSNKEQTALRASLLFDRDESLMADKIKGSEAQYANAKIRLLALAGFSEAERAQLLASRSLRDDPIADTRFSLDDQAIDVDPAVVKAANRKLITEASTWKNTLAPSTGRKAALKKAEAEDLLFELTRNPITRYQNRLKYDPEGQRGFCFGRAFAGHMLAIKTGVDKDSIRKIFVAGPMKTDDGIIWSFHVAVMIAKSGGGFWVIDPNWFQPQTVAEWYERHARQSMDQRLRLYITPASRFGGVGFSAYERGTLAHPFYNHYFVDLLSHFREAKAD